MSETKNTVFVTADGPVRVRGDLSWDERAPAGLPAPNGEVWLCRCGHSADKPFCDGSHKREGFSDPAAVSQAGPGAPGEGGPVTMRPRPSGPVLLLGNLHVEGEGGGVWSGTNLALCRCGHSGKKPFCDGTHTRTGFEAP